MRQQKFTFISVLNLCTEQNEDERKGHDKKFTVNGPHCKSVSELKHLLDFGLWLDLGLLCQKPRATCVRGLTKCYSHYFSPFLYGQCLLFDGFDDLSVPIL